MGFRVMGLDVQVDASRLGSCNRRKGVHGAYGLRIRAYGQHIQPTALKFGMERSTSQAIARRTSYSQSKLLKLGFLGVI